MWISRIALFIVFFWFGLLKIIGVSPAEALVCGLHHKTIVSSIPINIFMPFLGAIECIIGVLWLFPGATAFVFGLFCLQMIPTFCPLILMQHETWQASLTPSMVGQYIIKNIVLIACAYAIFEQQVISPVRSGTLKKTDQMRHGSTIRI